MLSEPPRRRSVGFLDRDGQTWSCFLVTFRGEDLRWYGYFSFRPNDGDFEEDEVRTADIFVEDTEAQIDQKARGLGRPLLSGLLSSALHTSEREENGTLKLRRWFRQILAENSQELAGEVEEVPEASNGEPVEEVVEDDDALANLRSLYASYRLDQVAHFIALVHPDDFEDAVDTILDGQSIDFGGKDRLQFAMMVVEHIETHLPLPTFEIWARDYLANKPSYELYAHTLHREGRLP